jgi:hypothetical protein
MTLSKIDHFSDWYAVGTARHRSGLLVLRIIGSGQYQFLAARLGLHHDSSRNSCRSREEIP